MTNEDGEPHSSVEQSNPIETSDLREVVEEIVEERTQDLRNELAEERARREELEERVEEVEAENDDLQERVEELEEVEEENHRTRASVSKLINELRDIPEGERLSAESPNLVAEASNTADELFDTMERARQNAGLLNFKEKRPETASVTEKYLQVLGRAEEKAEELGTNVVYLNYREVASHYGCAYKNDGYRVMEEMEERVPGVKEVDSRKANPEVDPTTTIDQKAIRVEWEHPDLRGWVRAHREEGE